MSNFKLPNVIEFKAPNQIIDSLKFDYRYFLAGSIEMGKASDWQKEFIETIHSSFGFVLGDYAIYNPRRDKWDASLEQVYENPTLYQQVNWELTALEWATKVYFYFDPNTTSPISLLELGIFKDKAIVNCPDGYCRKANVDIICEKYKIQQVKSHKEAIKKLFK